MFGRELQAGWDWSLKRPVHRGRESFYQYCAFQNETRVRFVRFWGDADSAPAIPSVLSFGDRLPGTPFGANVAGSRAN
jgi:hypothetical protein